MRQFVTSIYVVRCRQRTTTRLIYTLRLLSNLPSNNFNSLSTENYYRVMLKLQHNR